MNPVKFTNESRQRFLYILLAVPLVLFLILIKDQILLLLMAIIFAGLLNSVYYRLLRIFKGRKSLSSVVAILLFVILIVVPQVFLLIEIVEQASMVTKEMLPLSDEQVTKSTPGDVQLPKWFPFGEELKPYKNYHQNLGRWNYHSYNLVGGSTL